MLILYVAVYVLSGLSNVGLLLKGSMFAVMGSIATKFTLSGFHWSR